MSLVVWLPLNGNLTQQGLSDVQVTNNGATVSNDGKIGKCYYFTPNQWIKISIPEHMTTIKNTTVAAWVKSHSNTLALGGISHDSAATLAGITLYSSGWQLSGGGNWKYISSGNIANTQVWHHVACTIGDDEIITYLDGVKVTTTTLTAQAITNTTLTSTDNFIEIGCDHPGGDEYFTGYVNDFRVYDHCLSAKEVKELSKGLVLHWPLNRNGIGPSNLIRNGFGELGSENWTSAPSTDIPSGQSDIKGSFSGSTIEYIKIYPDHTYKMSAWIKATATSGTTYPSLLPYDIDKKFISTFNCPDGFSQSTMTTLKQELKSGDTKIYVNDLSQWNANSGHYYNWAAIFSYADSTGYVYPDGTYTQNCCHFGSGTTAKTNLDKTNNIITLMQAYTGPTMPVGTKICASTEGNTYYYPFGGINLASIQNWTYKESTFSSGVNRLKYAAFVLFNTYGNDRMAGIKLEDITNINLDSNIEYDCSGYNHNGTRTNISNWLEAGPRYNIFTHIGATNQKIFVSNLTTSGFGNSYSFAWWGRCNTWSGRMHWGFSDGIRLNGIYNGNLWNTGDGSSNPIYTPGTTTQVTVPDTNWHHWVMTGNGTKCYVYKDGVLWGEAKTYKAISGTSLYINGWSSSADYSLTDLDMSDFRIYSTALSAKDVLELYHTSASIDNKGNIYTYELEEV